MLGETADDSFMRRHVLCATPRPPLPHSTLAQVLALHCPPQEPACRVQAAAAMPDESERYGRIPARLEGRLMAFQREGVRFALRHGGRALIGDEMGLGKTVQVRH